MPIKHGWYTADRGCVRAGPITAREKQMANTAPTFVAGGKFTIDFGEYDLGRSLVLLPDGRFIVGGSFASVGSGANFLGRFNPDGTLDTTFGGDGIVTGAP